jgi:hypothetical protein
MPFDRNGMAAWCWEAAHALHELGRSVILIAAADASLPGTPKVEVVRVDMEGEPGDKERQAWDRARSQFSRQAFGRSILAFLESAARLR